MNPSNLKDQTTFVVRMISDQTSIGPQRPRTRLKIARPYPQDTIRFGLPKEDDHQIGIGLTNNIQFDLGLRIKSNSNWAYKQLINKDPKLDEHPHHNIPISLSLKTYH